MRTERYVKCIATKWASVFENQVDFYQIRGDETFALISIHFLTMNDIKY